MARVCLSSSAYPSSNPSEKTERIVFLSECLVRFLVRGIRLSVLFANLAVQEQTEASFLSVSSYTRHHFSV